MNYAHHQPKPTWECLLPKCTSKPKDNEGTFCKGRCGSRRPTTVSVRIPLPQPEPELKQDESAPEGLVPVQVPLREPEPATNETTPDESGLDEQVPDEDIGRTAVVPPRCGLSAYLTPTKKKRKSRGEPTTYRKQGNCRVCKAKTTYTCSVCAGELARCGVSVPDQWLCHTEKGKTCVSVHMQVAHP